jgi:multisubunit Na+/H+ antiporter MnhG subunit
MNKVRIIGIVILIIAVIIHFTLENDISVGISAFLFAIGIGLFIAGKINIPKIKP